MLIFRAWAPCGSAHEKVWRLNRALVASRVIFVYIVFSCTLFTLGISQLDSDVTVNLSTDFPFLFPFPYQKMSRYNRKITVTITCKKIGPLRGKRVKKWWSLTIIAAIPRLNSLFPHQGAWGPVSQRPRNYSSNIVVIIIVAQFLAHKTVHFASLTGSFTVSLSKFLNVNMEYTKQLFGPEKFPELSRNRPLVLLLKGGGGGGVFLGICGWAVLPCSFCYFKLIPQEIIPLFQLQVGVNGASLRSCGRSMEHKIGERTVCLVCSPKLS